MESDLLDRPETEMPEKKKAPKKTEIPTTTAEKTLARISAKYPERVRFKRKISHLWDIFYRVDYLPYYPEDRITSAFLIVTEKEIKIRERH